MMKYIIGLLLISMVLFCGCITGINNGNINSVITIKSLDSSNVVQCGYTISTAYYIIDNNDNVYVLGNPCNIPPNVYSVFRQLKVNHTYNILYNTGNPNSFATNGMGVIQGIVEVV